MARDKSMNVSISEDTKEELFVTITEEPYVPYKISDKLHKDLEKAYQALVKKKITPYQLKTLINKYPYVPTFYNYLSIAYENANQDEKVLPVIKTLVKKFPYYFHAQLNLLAHYIKLKNIEALDIYFENIKSIQDIMPKKEAFHVSEFTGFYSAIMEYLAEKPSALSISKMERITKMVEKTGAYFPDIKNDLPSFKNLLERTKILFEVHQKAKNEDAQVIDLKVKDKE